MKREYWLHNNGVIRDTDACPGEGLYCAPRRVAVIDPEDREQVERLSRGLPFGGRGVDAMQAALREFANPKPKLEEPGTWGVVEASCVHGPTRWNWIHDPDGNWHPIGAPNVAPDDWDSLVDPVLVREGGVAMTLPDAIGWAIAVGVLWTAISFPLGSLVGRTFRNRAADDAQTAADFGEPTRAQVEAGYGYGPRIKYGPRDVVDAHTMPISQSETAQRIRALIASNEAGRIDDEWAAWRGEAS